MRADGRSESPALPEDFFWVAWTQAINKTLGTSYAIEELQNMPSDDFMKLQLWVNSNAKR